MNAENNHEVEKQLSGREKLLTLEKEGKYVFHGSLFDIDVLEPREGDQFVSDDKKSVKDGESAVWATPFAEVAIFRSLINPEDVTSESQSEFGIDEEGRSFFKASQNLIDAAKKKTGKVYICDKKTFTDVDKMQVKSNEKIVPVGIVRVSYKDLPSNIVAIGDL